MVSDIPSRENRENWRWKLKNSRKCPRSTGQKFRWKGSPILSGSKYRSTPGYTTEKHWSKWGDHASFQVTSDEEPEDFGFLNSRLRSRKQQSNVFRILKKKDFQCWILSSQTIQKVLGQEKNIYRLARLPKTSSCASFLRKLLEDMCKWRDKPRKRMMWDVQAGKDEICRRMTARHLPFQKGAGQMAPEETFPGKWNCQNDFWSKSLENRDADN